MKLTLKSRGKRGDDEERRLPRYLFAGRVRTSTLVLIVALLAVWWVYDTYRPEPAPKPPAPQVVPPGFVPDPAYTWVPRTRVRPSPTATSTPTTTVPATTTTMPPPFTPPQLPCLLPPPFCPPSTTPATPPPQQPHPGPGPVPTSEPTSPPPAG